MMAGETIANLDDDGKNNGLSGMAALAEKAEREALLRYAQEEGERGTRAGLGRGVEVGGGMGGGVIGEKRKFVAATSLQGGLGGVGSDLLTNTTKKQAVEGSNKNMGGSTNNPEEIDIDDEDEGGGDQNEEPTGIKQKPVPLAVFGSAAVVVAST